MKPKVLLVYCHPSPRSFTRAVLDAVHEGLGDRCEVHTVDLHADGFDPVLHAIVKKTQKTPAADLEKAQERLALAKKG
jgi:NAD(P)H dehydrogenase (quinone)